MSHDQPTLLVLTTDFRRTINTGISAFMAHQDFANTISTVVMNVLKEPKAVAFTPVDQAYVGSKALTV